MKRFLLVPILAVGMVGWIAFSAPADASTSIAAAHPTVGVYCTHVAWTNPAFDGTYTLTLQSGGTLTAVGNGSSDAGTWSQHVKRIKLIISGVATYHGKKTAAGINTAGHPGTMSNTTGNSGTWYAVFEPGGC